MKRSLYLLLAAMMVLAVSCKKGPKVGTPSVNTLAATEIGPESARLNAKIDFAGVNWASVNFGFFWGTTEDAEGTYTMGEGFLDETNTYSAAIMGLALETEYWFKAFIEIDGHPYTGEILNFTTEGIPVIAPEAVDLGIVVNRKKIKWGSFNLGATKPEECGDYYAWGETETKDNYSWSTYQFSNSSSGPFSKYNTSSSYGAVDNKTVLETGPDGDDVASKLLGGKWRIPTDEEWTALRTNCTWTRTSNYNNTGIAGLIVKSNVSGYTDKSIFLPAAGYRNDADLGNVGSYGYYWSSSLNTDGPYDAWFVYFNSGGVSRNGNYRFLGLSVRPVTE